MYPVLGGRYWTSIALSANGGIHRRGTRDAVLLDRGVTGGRPRKEAGLRGRCPPPGIGAVGVGSLRQSTTTPLGQDNGGLPCASVGSFCVRSALSGSRRERYREAAAPGGSPERVGQAVLNRLSRTISKLTTYAAVVQPQRGGVRRCRFGSGKRRLAERGSGVAVRVKGALARR